MAKKISEYAESINRKTGHYKELVAALKGVPEKPRAAVLEIVQKIDQECEAGMRAYYRDRIAAAFPDVFGD